MSFTLTAIQRAWDLKDPALVDYMLSLAQQKEPSPTQPIRDEALTFPRFLRTIFSYEFRQLPAEEQYNYRVEQLALLSADDAEVPLSDRLKLHSLILLIYSDDSFYARHVLIEMIRRLPLQYGVWKAFKAIYKQAEKNADHQLLGELIARFDYARSNHDSSISGATLLYMVRRGWRYLRKLGESLPVCYPDAASACLAAYPDNTYWQQTWVANHIWHHQSKRYGMASFDYIYSKDLLKNRAFDETWQRTPEPLLRLLSVARAEKVRQYACNALTENFKFFLRDIDTQWIVQLAALPVESPAIDDFVVWLLKNSPKLEQHQFKTLGLHQVVIDLLTSKAKKASDYACQYVKTHARDMELSVLLRLMNNNNAQVRQLAKQLLSERNPRKDVGLDAWGQLLEYKHSHSFASSQLLRHFGRKELSAEWFQQRLLSTTRYGVQFSKANLLELHPRKKLGINYFQQLLADLDTEKDNADTVADFCLKQLELLGLQQLSPETLQTYLLHPLTRETTMEWFDNERIKANILPIAFYQALVYQPSWDEHPFIQSLRQSAPPWGQQLRFAIGEYYDDLATYVRRWLSDVRRFKPADLGFDWLMRLVGRVEEQYHDFAVDIMIRAFVPADFSTGGALAGSQALLAMAMENSDTPMGKFALKYLRHHHPQLGLKLTSRPVDPHAALPKEFICFAQFEQLFAHAHTPLRHFALSVAHWEFADWQVSNQQLVALCESKYADVREFIYKALLEEANDENKGYRISATALDAKAVYQFCYAKKSSTRQLGMQLIRQHESFQQPEALFQLTESPEREIRSFAVRILWSLYRRYATTSHWKPYVPVAIKGTKAQQKKQQAQQQQQLTAGLPKRPENLPADKEALQQLLRRWLYELPPGGFAHATTGAGTSAIKRLQPLPACLAKKYLIEAFRDLALEDHEFAQMILPLFQNFTQSRGAMEQAACLVAVTRIEHSYPQLATGV